MIGPMRCRPRSPGILVHVYQRRLQVPHGEFFEENLEQRQEIACMWLVRELKSSRRSQETYPKYRKREKQNKTRGVLTVILMPVLRGQ